MTHFGGTHLWEAHLKVKDLVSKNYVLPKMPYPDTFLCQLFAYIH